MKCFYCRRPLDFMSLHVDHVLPISLKDIPGKLESTLTEYQINESFPGFSIEGLSNLVPSHGASCNLRKRAVVFPKAAALFYLQTTHGKLPRVLAELARLKAFADRGNALGLLATLVEGGKVSAAEVTEMLAGCEFRRSLDEPLLVTLGLNFAEAMEMRGLEATVDTQYAIACDMLESELVDAIRRLTDYSFHYTEASARSGETLSVRLVFPEVARAQAEDVPIHLITAALPWWVLLEETSYYEVYGQRYRK